MKRKSAIPGRLICLGVLSILLLAFAIFMVVSPNAPRLAQIRSGTSEGQTQLTLYEGPKTMTSSETAKITANGQELFVYDVMVNHVKFRMEVVVAKCYFTYAFCCL